MIHRKPQRRLNEGVSKDALDTGAKGVAGAFKDPEGFEKFQNNVRRWMGKQARKNVDMDELVRYTNKCMAYKDNVCVDRYMGKEGSAMNSAPTFRGDGKMASAKLPKSQADLKGYWKCKKELTKGCLDTADKSLALQDKIDARRPKSCKDKCKTKYNTSQEIKKCKRGCTAKSIGKGVAIGAGIAATGAGIMYGKQGISSVKKAGSKYMKGIKNALSGKDKSTSSIILSKR